MVGGRRDISPERAVEILKVAVAMRSEGKTWDEVSAAVRIGREWLKRRMVKGFRSLSNRRVHQRLYGDPLPRRQRRTTKDTYQLPEPPPEDTRTLTARLCGDPLPGRSALDRRQA